MNNTNTIRQSNLETPTGGSIMLRLVEDGTDVRIKVQVLTTDAKEHDELNRWCVDWFDGTSLNRSFQAATLACKGLDEGLPLFADITHSCAHKVARMQG